MGAMKDEAIKVMEERKASGKCPTCGNPSQLGSLCIPCSEEYYERSAFDDVEPSEDDEGWD